MSNFKKTISVNTYSLGTVPLCLGTEKSYGFEKISFSFSSEWSGLFKTVTFYPPKKKPVSIEGIEAGVEYDVPAEVTARGGYGEYVVSGCADGKRIYSVSGAFEVLASRSDMGVAPEWNGSQGSQGDPGKDGGEGLSDTAKALLLTILRSGVYTSNQKANITALEIELNKTAPHTHNFVDGICTVCGAVDPNYEGGNGGDGGDDTHTHSYTSAVTTQATCTTAGVRTYTCSCGHIYTEAIPATGHNFVDGICTVCGAVDPNYEGGNGGDGGGRPVLSVTYSGGAVAVGTHLDDLTGIVVTAVYDDGSTGVVTDYVLSNTRSTESLIVEGTNVILVFDRRTGAMTEFTVTGIAN